MLPRESRLNLTATFSKFKREGRSYKSSLFVLLWLPQQKLEPTKVGFVVSNRIGKAVVRNRIRRLFREAVNHLLASLPTGVDLVFIANHNTPKTNLEALKMSVAKALVFVSRNHKEVGG